ncbi:MAG: SUMF1/EgtB/PvdO family nonheme iron enzyme, partial [Phycisphaerae bacterium]
ATETQRNISLSFSEPLQISPNSGINVDREFGGDSPSIIYTIENTSAIDMTVTATATDPEITDGPATWVSINGEAGEIEWTIAPGDVIEVEVILLVPLLPKGVHQASIRFENECTGNAVTRNQVIDILPLFDVEATTEAVFSGGIGGPFEPESVEVSLINRVDRPIDWMVSFVPIEPTKTATWIEADPAEGTLQSVNDEVTINLSMTVAATELPADAYAATIRFSTPEGFVDEYVVGLNIAQLTLTPSEGTTFSGPRNGPFTPVDVKYTVLNPEFKDFEWQATILEDCDADEPTAIDWLEVTPSQGVIGIPGATAEMTVSVTNQALALQTGEYEAYLCVSQIDPTDPNGAVLTTAERRMKLDVGTSAFSLPMTMIEDEPAPAEGPTHRFRWATTEVTNSDFARFLNDVEVDGGESPRSRNVARDPDSGTLTILDDGTLLYQTNADNEESRIEYDPLAPLGIRYKADVAYGNHPVNFVSWYGAVKYCNWLTHVQGMADQIVYLEGPTAADWRPVTDDPKSLLELFGFRLPMDGGAEEAGEHNEWYKVASARFDEENEYTFDAIYGFGRDEIGNEDANFLNSGDPFDGSTTPVGFYDGRTYNGGGDGTIGNGNEFSTAPNINAYGIHDLSGNVSEWMHDRDPQHVVRGGNLDNAASSDRLKVVSRAFFAPQSVSRAIGFRVAQSVPVTIDDLALSRTKAPIRISGFVGGPMEFVTEGAVSEASVEIQNASAFAADDIAITLTPSGTPLQFVGATPQLVPANQQAVIRLVLDETRTGIGPSPAPPGNFKLVTGEQTPDGGPVHDFWINENEVTNSGFAAFLNDLLGNITGDPEDQDERSDFIYIDSLTGNVYLHDEQEGTLGLGPPAQGIQLYDMTCEDLTYDGEEYETVSARNNWPVRCLNWFACVKYCNWLSQSDGIPQELRAYSEGSAQELEAWRPITMSVEQWNNGPGDAERQVLIENTMGYRLPMDANASVHERFNEWYKAAAWQPLENIDSVYGFGRDELNPVDANIMGNQDTEEDSPTPVGFFNGTNNLYNPPATCETPQSDATSTASGDNGYELQDITGNVAEWMQSPGSDAGHQNVRGGSWKDMTDSLRLRNDNIATLLATETRDDVGFRLVRGPGRVIKLKVENRTSGQSVELPFILDLKEPFSTLPREDVMLSGMYGDDFNTISETFDTINRSNTDMEIELTSAVEWLDVDDGSSEEEEDPITLTGLETLAWTVQSNESINELPPGEHTTSILIKNETTLQTRSRQFIIDIAKPFDVLPATGEPESPRFVGLVGGPFEVVDSKENAPD